jgi:drug/metabolite transporter (DMT)-like permease
MKAADAGLAVLIMLLWALCYPVISIGLAFAPPLWFAGLRALIAGGILIAVGAVLRRPWPRGWKTWVALAAVGLTGTTLGFSGMFLGGGLVSPGLATVISNAQPIIAALMASVAFGESLKGMSAIAILAGFTGIALISVPSFTTGSESVTAQGAGLVLLAALGVATGNVLMKKLAGQVDAFILMGAQLVIGAVPLLVLAAVFESGNEIDWSAQFFGALLVLAVLGTAFANLLWFQLLDHIELNKLNTFTFLTPIFALAIGAGFFGERLTAVEMGGTGLVILALILSSRSNDSNTLNGRSLAKTGGSE